MRPQEASASKRFLSLDALRGWAICGVVLVHSGQLAPGNGIVGGLARAGQYGVQLFFFVSALTISITYDAHIGRFGSSLRSQAAWLTKRVFRIAPLYYVGIVVYRAEYWISGLIHMQLYATKASFADIAANLLFIHTWFPSAINSVVPGGWSIGAEVCFYLLVPLIWRLNGNFRVLASTLIAGSILMLALSTVMNHLVLHTFFIGNNLFFYLWFPTQASVFAVGVVLYKSGALAVTTWQRSALLAVSAATVAGAVYVGTEGDLFPALSPLLLSIAFATLLMAHAHAPSTILYNEIMARIGRLSYGIYIFHFVIIDLIRYLTAGTAFSEYHVPFVWACALLGATMLSMISRKVVEAPAVEYGRVLSLEICGRGNHADATSMSLLDPER